MVAELRFDALGTRVEIRLAADDETLLGPAEQRLRDLERRWSRFVDDSELCRLNRAGGRPTIVSPETFRLVALALEAHRRTGGLFDPRVLAALERAGYVASHETLAPDDGPLAPAAVDPGSSGVMPATLEVDLDPALRAVTLPPGERWDAGGIGKGLACDVLVEELVARGAVSVMVNLGGDIRVHGEALGEPCWTVQVGHPRRDDERFADVHLTEGSVATSSRAKRRWRHGGRSQHHLIDPRTGLPAETDLVAVTVVAGSTWWAEVLAKAALIAGPRDGRDLVEAAGCSALFVDVAGRARTIGDHVHLGALA